jgi:prevent-host-death family protein
MRHVTLEEAGALLSELVREAQAGEDVFITQGDTDLVKLVPVKPRRQAGSAKGISFYMSEDFDETPEDFKEYL